VRAVSVRLAASGQDVWALPEADALLFFSSFSFSSFLACVPTLPAPAAAGATCVGVAV